MDYRQFVDDVKQLHFIEDEESADSAIKSVLGILVSRLQESDARSLTEAFPEPLTYDVLRGQKVWPAAISMEESVSEMEKQFDIDREQALQLISRVIRVARQCVPEDKLHLLAAQLPAEWGALLETN